MCGSPVQANLVWTEPKLDTAPINGRIGHSMCAAKTLTGGGDVTVSDDTTASVAATSTDGGGGGSGDGGSGGGGCGDGSGVISTNAESKMEVARETEGAVSTAKTMAAGPVITDVTPMFSDTMPVVPKVSVLPAASSSDAAAADVLLVFGGIDLAGQFFEDCALLRP
jgi:hypothetical protein